MTEGRKLPWWVLPALLALMLLLGLLGRHSALRLLEDELSRAAETQRLRDEGLLAAQQEAHAPVYLSAKKLEATNAELRAELERARKAAPKATVERVYILRTAPLLAHGDLRLSPTPPVGDAPCLLAPGDPAELRMESVELRTKEGNSIVSATLSAWRLDSKGPVELLKGPVESKLSKVEVTRPTPTKETAVGYGVMTSLGSSGWEVGPAVATPPLRFLGTRSEAIVAATFGPAGSWSAQAAALVRW